MKNLTKLNRRRWAVQLALTTGVALLFLAALLWGLQGMTPARAGPGTLYVDGATGSDTTDCISPAASTATARYVATTGSDGGNDCTAQGSPCRTVQHAVAIASPGDVIKVAAGDYSDVRSYPAPPGPWSPSGGVITQAVYISKTVAIQGGYTTTNWMSPDPDMNPTTLDAQDQGRVLYVTGDISPTIAGLRITGGDAMELRGAWEDAGGGVYVAGATVVFSSSRIFGNSAVWGGGLYIVPHSTVILLSSTVSTNTAEEGAGLYVYNSAATLDDSTVSNNVAAPRTGLNYRAGPATLGAKLIGPLGAPGHGGGAAAWVNSTLTITGSKIISNTAESGGGAGLWLNESTATLHGSTVTSNTADFKGGGLSLWYNSAVVLDGSTLTGNTANEGAGLLLGYHSAATLTNNTIADNHAGHGGGGIMVDKYAQAQIANAAIEHNSADYGGGIAVRSGASAFISGTRVVSNTADNSGGGVGIWASGPVVVMANTVISDNYGHDAGGVAMWELGGTFTGTNLLVADNRSGPGPAGIALWGSSGGQLTNVTVSGNDSATGLDGAEVEGPVSGFPIVNSIFWGNGTDGSNLGGSNLNVSYSDVQGGFAGTYNISADPLFIGGGDYHLGVGSPCIDKGTLAGAPTHDIEGTPRDAVPDMGAYEWTGFRIFLPLALKDLTVEQQV
jgi:hypothetical protein